MIRYTLLVSPLSLLKIRISPFLGVQRIPRLDKANTDHQSEVPRSAQTRLFPLCILTVMTRLSSDFKNQRANLLPAQMVLQCGVHQNRARTRFL